MSIAEILDAPLTRAPLIPPRPPLAPDDLSALGRLALIRSNAIASWGQRAYEDDIIQGRFFGRSSFILNTPDAIRHVLVENYENYTRTPAGIRVLRPILGEGLLLAEGRAWKNQRRTLAPAFAPRAIPLLIPHMLAATDDAIGALRHECGKPVDLREAMQRLALDIAGRTMFSFELDRHGPALRGFVNDYGDRLAQPRFFDLLLPLGWPSPSDVSRAMFRRRWTRFMRGLITERRALGTSGGAPRDLFDLMVAARDPETNEAFSDEQLGDQVSTMILAGHETTATALFWSLYLLALDPATQDELAAEAKGALAAGALDVARLTFTRAVLDETMRLYPPAFLIVRAAAGPDTVAGASIARRDVVLISPWLLHRHEKLWDQPNAFRPSRFLPGNQPPDRFAYLPFGVGPRVCIGAQFALTEATLALAKLIGTFKVELLDREPVTPVGVVTTQPDRSPMFRIVRRD
ncbi:cytochrome P450 [Afipia birgiae]|jgi:unspecific monooxygenase|uniref:cytochrome P450 n=1 Tax=Afipia birgiae TaxID=151414 RepID=UPI0002ED5D81|nr:cytochrome P450 [Afipia birgiae]MBX9820673.1 cytochrome P450 [Afipia birgiae]